MCNCCICIYNSVIIDCSFYNFFGLYYSSRFSSDSIRTKEIETECRIFEIWDIRERIRKKLYRKERKRIMRIALIPRRIMPAAFFYSNHPDSSLLRRFRRLVSDFPSEQRGNIHISVYEIQFQGLNSTFILSTAFDIINSNEIFVRSDDFLIFFCQISRYIYIHIHMYIHVYIYMYVWINLSVSL